MTDVLKESFTQAALAYCGADEACHKAWRARANQELAAYPRKAPPTQSEVQSVATLVRQAEENRDAACEKLFRQYHKFLETSSCQEEA